MLIFGWIDYGIFSVLLGVSLLIGAYFGYFGRNENTTEYLFAGKKMTFLPISISILASLLSGVTFLGVPTEIYLHGTVNAATTLSIIGLGLFTFYLTMPVFWDLNIDSCYEYLELRFSKSVRTYASVLYIFALFLYTPIVIYAPALAFSQVTGFEIDLVTIVFSLVCIIYTSFGGVKAVIWTEILQFSFALLSLFSILILGLVTVGGLLETWSIADSGGRLKLFELNPSLYQRDTVWAMGIGSFVTWTSRVSVGQKFIQRFLTVEKRVDIDRSIVIMTIGWVIINSTCILTGLVMYAHYHDCDPIKAKLVDRSDQILPFYVMDIAGHIPGLPGLFLAGLVSSGLSTMSSSLNTLSAIVYDDVLARWIPEGPKKSFGDANFMKVVCLVIGSIIIGLTFLIQRLGTLFEMSSSLSSAADAPLLSLFLLGLLCPWVGKIGAVCGSMSSLVFTIFLVGGGEWRVFTGNHAVTELPTSVENCSRLLANFTTIAEMEAKAEEIADEPFFFFRISVMYFSTLGTIVGVVAGMVAGLLLKKIDEEKRNPDHYAPILQRFLAKTGFENQVTLKSFKTVKKT